MIFDVRNQLPRGVSDYFGVELVVMENVESTFLRTALSWGYTCVRPALFEYEDVLRSGIGKDLRRKIFRVDDWQSGLMLAIPPDITPQIARISSTRFREHPLPHRLSYSGRVLRHTESQAGMQREIHQVGVEYIGFDGIAADAEIVLLALDFFNALNINDLTLVISHALFMENIFDLIENEELLQAVRQAVGKKDVSTLECLSLAGGLDPKICRLLKNSIYLLGGREVLSNAFELGALPTGSINAIRDIHNFLDIVDPDKKLNIVIDLGDTQRYEYHTGIVFEGYVSGGANPMFKGGRYDDLMKNYGGDSPATGLTCNVHEITTAITQQDGLSAIMGSKKVLIIMPNGYTVDVKHISSELRALGFSVVMEYKINELELAIQRAKLTNIEYILSIANESCTLVSGNSILEKNCCFQDVVPILRKLTFKE